MASPVEVLDRESRGLPSAIEILLGALGVGLAVVLQVLSVRSFLGGGIPFASILSVAGGAVFAAGFPALLPRDAVYPRVSGRAPFFFWATFIPVLGPVALTLFVPWALHGRTPPVPDPFREIYAPDLPSRPLFMGEGAPLRFSEGALSLVLRHAPDPDKRVAAVMALRRMAESRATPLLRIALKDPVDDVRLLAYALTDGIDKDLATRVREGLELLDRTPPHERSGVHKAIAQDYWDMAFLGLASADVEAHVLGEACRHLERALELRPDGGAAFLLGRARLRQRRPTEAEAAFARARALGLPSVAVGPYRAEAAFLLRRFELVLARLRELPSTSRARLPLAEVMSFWIGEELSR